MPIDPDKIYADLPADPRLGAHELLKRLKPKLKTDTDYLEACGYIEAFYQANNWKFPDRINAGGYSLNDSPEAWSEAARAVVS